MTSINRTPGNGNQNFKQIEGDSWQSVYLPVICAGIVMAVVLAVAIACSKQSNKPVAKISAPSTSMPATSAAPSSSAAPVLAKKLVKKQRPANATYVNATYGVSFSYPRKYSLEAGSNKSSMPVPASFLKPGAIEVASVDMPDDLYPDTDFSSALLNVSVNPGLTADECAQFVPNANDADAAKPASAKLGVNEFAEVEQMKGGEANAEPTNGGPTAGAPSTEASSSQSDLKYFHVFKNGACYEFALDVETSRKADVDLAQADHGKIFQQLEKILASTRIKDVALPGVETPQTTARTAIQETPPASAATPAPTQANVVTPEQK
jgi:hypothetical protein